MGRECPYLGDDGYCTLTSMLCIMISNPDEDLPEKYWEWCWVYQEEISGE